MPGLEEFFVLRHVREANVICARRENRADLAAKWPIVSASYLPLLALLGARLLGGTSASTAAYLGLAVTFILLTAYGWSGSRASGLRGLAQLLMAAAGAIGAMMILLKALLVHLY
jgi:hypothetical protein